MIVQTANVSNDYDIVDVVDSVLDQRSSCSRNLFFQNLVGAREEDGVRSQFSEGTRTKKTMSEDDDEYSDEDSSNDSKIGVFDTQRPAGLKDDKLNDDSETEDEVEKDGEMLTIPAAEPEPVVVLDTDDVDVSADVWCTDLEHVWDCDKVCLIGIRGSEGEQWQCLHCNRTFKGHNATKALRHLSRNDIGIEHCKAIIPDRYTNRYKRLYNRIKLKKTNTKKRKEEIFIEIEEHHEEGADKLKSSRKRSRRTATSRRKELSPTTTVILPTGSYISPQVLAPAAGAVKKNNASVTNTNSFVLSQSARTVKNASSEKKRQKTLYDDANDRCDIKFADMLIGEGLSFTLASSDRMKAFFNAAKTVSQDYKLPGEKLIRTKLLDLNYSTYDKRETLKLMQESEVFGLMYIGDGATIGKMPMVNMLCVGVHNPAKVLEIADTSEIMESGGKKDAGTIARMFVPHIERMDNAKSLSDLISFDGASAVQKAGQIMQVSYPRMYCIHGAEHSISLFFKDVAHLSPIAKFIREDQLLYRVFGSGSMHAPYAIFKQHAREHNDNVEVGMIRGVTTRFGFFFYSFHRNLRLKMALESTVTCNQFNKLKYSTNKLKKVKEIVLRANRWKQLFFILRVMFRMLCLLRMSDSNTPGMDKLYYAVLMTTEGLKKKSVQDAFRTHFPESVEVITDVKKFFDEHGSDDDDDDEDCIEEKDDEEEEDLSDEEDEEEYYSMFEQDKFDNLLPSDSIEEDKNLGAMILKAWLHRSKNLCHDPAIAASLLSVLPEIHEYWKSNVSEIERDAMDRLLRRTLPGLCCEDNEEKISDCIGIFWLEFTQFQNKTGPFRKEYIWSNSTAKNGESHVWHQSFSLNYTKVLGKVGCRWTSKVLGIGQAERNWKVVKRLKKARPNLKIDSLEKQGVIVAVAGMQRGRAMLMKDKSNQLRWLKDDEDFDLGLKNWNVDFNEANKNRKDRPVRKVNAWVEDWEKEIMKKNDQLVEQKLLSKYENLEFVDQEDELRYRIIPENLDYKRRLGWHVLGAPPHYKGDSSDDDLLLAFKIDEGLWAVIVAAEQPDHLNVKFILPR
jgi:hypothetical protein